MKQVQTFPDGAVLFEHCASYGFEGIVSKRIDRPYVSGPCRVWTKTKCPRKRDKPSAIGCLRMRADMTRRASSRVAHRGFAGPATITNSVP